jgi:hypothetical protein
MESKFDVDVLEAVCMGHNTGVYIEQDAPQLESQMDKGVEEITVTVPAGELQWGYKDSGEPPTVEVEPNNGQDQAIEYFDAPLHHNVPLEHDVIQDMYSYAQEKAGVGNPVNQEMFNEMSALQAIQYCTAKGFIFIHADNELFIPFHESTVMVINAIAEKFYSYKGAKDNPRLSKWRSCSFNGDETFVQVATILLDIAEPCLSDYTKFVVKIPCTDLLYSIHPVKDNNTSVVSLMMTLDAFADYILATNVALEMHPAKEVSLSHADINTLEDRGNSDTERVVDESSAHQDSDELLKNRLY